MKKFGDIPRTNGSFPYTSSVADATPGDKTGTPLHKTWVDHILAFPEAALNGAFLTPNDTADAAGVSSGDIESNQVLQAIQQMFCPPGTIVAWPHDTIPAGIRYLKLNGQRVLRATYPRLVANVERTYAAGGAYYRSDVTGASQPTTGTYLKLPDYNGVTLRGRDLSGARDPDGAARLFGDLQADALQRHNHMIKGEGITEYFGEADYGTTGGGNAVANSEGVGAGATVVADETQIGEDIGAGFTSVTGVGRVDVETRMKNSVVQWVITY